MVSQFSAGSYNQPVYPYQQQKSSVPYGAVITLGAFGGGAVGYFRNRYPVGKDGSVSDEFAKRAFDKHVKKNFSSDGKKFFEQIKTLMKKVGKAKDAESLKNLLKSNPLPLKLNEAGINLESYLNSITKDNYKTTKDNIKRELEEMNKNYYRNFKTITQACWDKESKKFVKPDGVEKKIFDVIRKTGTDSAMKKALKYGGITAGVLGALTIGCKILAARTAQVQPQIAQDGYSSPV